MHILPTQQDSKTLCFMNSPKIWTKNFMSYLKETHTELYLTIIDILRVIQAIVFMTILWGISYIVGYNCIEVNDLIEEIGMFSYIVISIIGIGAIVFVCGIFVTAFWIIEIASTSFMCSYVVLCEFMIALNQYNATKKNLNA